MSEKRPEWLQEDCWNRLVDELAQYKRGGPDGRPFCDFCFAADIAEWIKTHVDGDSCVTSP